MSYHMGTVHFGLLNHLAKHPKGATPKRLAFAFQVPKTSMTHMVRVLEGEGLVETVPDPEDARSKVVRTTPQGGKLLAETYAKVAA